MVSREVCNAGDAVILCGHGGHLFILGRGCHDSDPLEGNELRTRPVVLTCEQIFQTKTYRIMK